jgi:hypothetical protein
VGVSSTIIESPDGVVARVAGSATGTVTTADLEAFDPSELSLQLSASDGVLYGSSGIATVHLLDSGGVLATQYFPITIEGTTAFLTSPGTLTSWLEQYVSSATGISVSVNVSALQSASSGVTFNAVLDYDGVPISNNVSATISAPVKFLDPVSKCPPLDKNCQPF